jgi:hypothetical protein
MFTSLSRRLTRVFFLLLVLVLVPDCLMVLGIELLLAFVLFFLLLFSLFFGGGFALLWCLDGHEIIALRKYL